MQLPSYSFLPELPRQLLLAAGVAAIAACVRPEASDQLSPGISIDTATVAVNGTWIFYEAAGRGTPVVLLHSGNLDRRLWDPQFLALAREHRVIRYDARGYGRSGRADTPYRADEDLHGLLLALRLPRASLVGASLGGRIAIDYALAHPEAVDRLVLAAPGLSGWDFTHRDTTWLPEARAARARGDSAGIALAWLQQDFMQAAMERPALAASLRAIAADNGRFWMEVIRYGGEADLQGSPPALHRTTDVRAPTLLIVGTRDTPDIAAIADTLAASIPGLRRVTFAGAGHLVSMEYADRFTDAVLAFLRPGQ